MLMMAHSQAYCQPDGEGGVSFAYEPTPACEQCNYQQTPGKCASVVQLVMAQNGSSTLYKIPVSKYILNLRQNTISRTTFEMLSNTFCSPEDRYGSRMKMAICDHAL